MSQPIARMTGAIAGAPIAAVPSSATKSWLHSLIMTTAEVVQGGAARAVSVGGGLARMLGFGGGPGLKIRG
jgi:hypothetical protein